MRSDILQMVTCHINPLGWSRRDELTRRFLEENAGRKDLEITLVEVALGNRPFQFSNYPGVKHLGCRAGTLAWAKESALNVGLRHLPDYAEKVCWPDADITWRDHNWVEKTLLALDIMPVVQPWSQALDLGPDGEVMTVKGRQVQTSFGWVWREIGTIIDWWKNESYNYPHSGYAWASTIQFLNDIGMLLDFSGLGAADHQMSLGMVGHIDYACHQLSSTSYRAQVEAWGRRAYAACQGHVGYVPGRIEHHWHGEKSKRRYVERWDILNRHQFDPHTDVHRNRHGILELSNNKPAFRREVEQYFRQRSEDANVRQGA